MAQTVTFTTYKQDGVSISGTPFVLGFKDKTDDNFDNTGDSAEADLELPPPPPPGGTNGTPVSTSYIDTMYIHLDDDIKGYQYFLSNDTTDELALDLAVRDYEADNVTFKYNQDSVTNMFGKLEITNGSWTIDLVTSTVTGASNGLPSISTVDSVTTVVLPHLGDGVYYTMNVQKFVEGPTRLRGNINNDLDSDGNGVVDVADLVFLQKYLNGVTEQVTLANADSDFIIGANVNNDVDSDGNGVVDVADLVFLQKHLNKLSGYEIPGTNFS